MVAVCLTASVASAHHHHHAVVVVAPPPVRVVTAYSPAVTYYPPAAYRAPATVYYPPVAPVVVRATATPAVVLRPKVYVAGRPVILVAGDRAELKSKSPPRLCEPGWA